MHYSLKAFEEMRIATISLLEEEHEQRKVAKKCFLHQIHTSLKLFVLWLGFRFRKKTLLSDGVIVLYSPSRTPKESYESDRDFVQRLTRSNRKLCLLDLLDLNERPIQVISVLPGLSILSRENKTLSLVDFIFILIGVRQFSVMSLACINAIVKRRSISTAFKVSLLQQLRIQFEKTPQTLVLLTSNSTLCEYIRLSACGAHGNRIIEVLHGIASTGMEDYYRFISNRSEAKILYVNLIAGLPHFQSIERHLLKDTSGEIAINCQLWSKLGASNSLEVTLLQNSVAIIGGTSQEENYYRGPYFERELKIMSCASKFSDSLTIYYCPHPANGDDIYTSNLLPKGVKISPLSTIQTLLSVHGVIGSYSTSLFEAALLGKDVLLLPTKDGLLMEELKQLGAYIEEENSILDEVNHFLSGIQSRTNAINFDDLLILADTKLGLTLRKVN